MRFAPSLLAPSLFAVFVLSACASEGASFQESYAVEPRFPESGSYDPTEHAFYVGSLADGSVTRIDADTSESTTVFTETAPGIWWTLGMHVDDARRRLWVCAMEDRREVDEGTPGHVWVLDLDTGERVATYPLGDAFDGATCTDVTVADDGSAYVCDREHPNVYRVDPAGALSLFATDEALSGDVVGQNALLVLPDQSALLSAVYLDAKLLRVDLADGSVTEVAIEGSFRDRSLLSGADGMTLHEGELLVAFSSKLARLRSADGWTTAAATLEDAGEGLTDVVSTPGGAYLLDGQAVSFALGEEPTPSRLVRVP